MKKMRGLLACLCAAALLAGSLGAMQASAAESDPTGVLKAETPGNRVQTYQYQEAQDFVLNITNTGSETVKDIRVVPVLGSGKKAKAKWPFKTEYQSYEEKIDALEAGKTDSVRFSFTQRDDAGDSRYTLTFEITAETAGGQQISAEKSFYVNTSAKPEKASGNSENREEEKQEQTANAGAGSDGIQTASAGGFDNGEAVYSGGSGLGSGSASVPRVIVTGFSTDPAEVKAGSDFTLTIHLKNTSKTTRVSNMLFELSAPSEGNDEQTTAPSFLPTSGSNSIYLDGIGANAAADISIKLNAKADLVQKPYEIALSMKYEDASATQIESAANLSIPVKQNARFEFSDFEITPESIAVGEEANVTCNLYNLGRIKLYNARAVFEGEDIKREETFLGNLESGSSTAIDVMLEAENASGGDGEVTMTLSYEDESGNLSSTEKTFLLPVSEASADDDMQQETFEEEGQSTFPVVPVVIGALAAAAAVAAVVIARKKKARRLAEEEEGLLDELDGPSEDERQ